MKKRAAIFIRNTAISVAVLLVMVLGTGVAYTWYVGQNSTVDTTAIATPVEPAPAPVIKPPKLAADAKISVSTQAITGPIVPGENASITIKTLPGAKCSITVEYDEVPSTDSGLKPLVADDFGLASWTWTVEPTVPLGTWPVDVTCALKEQSAMVRGNLEVAAESE